MTRMVTVYTKTRTTDKHKGFDAAKICVILYYSANLPINQLLKPVGLSL